MKKLIIPFMSLLLLAAMPLGCADASAKKYKKTATEASDNGNINCQDCDGCTGCVEIGRASCRERV